MELKTQIQVKSNQYLYRYLREKSGWYKDLNRNHESIKVMEKEMKNYYKMTTQDKIDSISKRVEMISTFIDVLR